jgi:hypothetical protein
MTAPREREPWLFAGLVVLHLLPVWLFPYFPSQDGPCHVDTANILSSYLRPELSSFREYYVINPELVPNWLTHLFLAGAAFFMSPRIAEKLLLSAYLILLPVSIRWMLGIIDSRARSWAFMAFPFVGNLLLHLGFYNFSCGLPLFFFVLGIWFRSREHWTLQDTVSFGLLCLLLYFCHIVPFFMACGSVAILAVWLTLFDAAEQIRHGRLDLRVLWQAWRMRALVPLYAALPALLLAYEFLIRHRGSLSRGPFSMDQQWCQLRDLRCLVSYEAAELWPARAVFWLFGLLVLGLLIRKAGRRNVERADGWVVLAAVCLLLYFGADAVIADKMLSLRLMVFPFFALILWLAAQPPIRLAQAAAACLAVVQLGIHTAKYAELNDYLREYLSGMELVEPNTTLLALSFSHKGTAPDGRRLSESVEVFRHASGYLTAQRDAIDLLNFEAGLDPAPVLYRPGLNPYRFLLKGQQLDAEPPQAEFLAYSGIGGHVDYVLLWSLDPRRSADGVTNAILGQLRLGYQEIYTSPQRGLMHLYRRKDWTEKGVRR